MCNVPSRALPVGVYAVSAAFDGSEGPVTFVFRGETFAAEVGKNAFVHLEAAIEAATVCPDAPFLGTAYDTPVLLFPAGAYAFGHILTTAVPRAMTLLGEDLGVSPNGPAFTGASVLKGSFYYGTLVMTGEGTMTLDGLVLDTCRVRDARPAGENMGLVLRNCLFTGALTATLVHTAALTGGTRAVTLTDCRLDGYDALDAEGGMLFAGATALTLERVTFTRTKKFLGLTDYNRTYPNTCPGQDAAITFRDCAFTDSEAVHGLALRLPEDAGNVAITLEGCTLRGLSPADEPAIHVNLPHAGCSLTLKNTVLTGKPGQKSPAILLEGCPEAKVDLSGATITGFTAPTAFIAARRTQAPALHNEAAWPAERLEDPHRVTEGDFGMLEALYSGRTAYHGDPHVHSDSGGTSDGATPLAQFVKDMKKLQVDFAAIVDHQQMRHMCLPEWDNNVLICGTEPGTEIVEEGRAPRSAPLHYVMLFPEATDLARVMAAFPEYEFTGGPDGHFKYPKFTPERLEELARFVRGLGGNFTHAHPRQLMASDDPLDFYFTDDVMLETIYVDPASYSTAQNMKVWEGLLKLGKRVCQTGCSDTHGPVSNEALTTVYAREARGAAYLREIREGDCAAGGIGIKMAIAGARMGSHLPYRPGMTLTVEVEDAHPASLKPDTVYALKVYTERGLAYAGEFDGTLPQRLALAVEDRAYYRVEITNESDGHVVGVSNPIWLDPADAK